MLFAWVAALAPCGWAAPPSVETYAATPEASLVRLSPGGRYLAYATTFKARRVLAIADLNGGGPPTLAAVDPFELIDVRWKDDDHIVIALRNFYVDDGVPAAATRLVVVKRDGTGMRDLAAVSKYGNLPQIQNGIVSLLPDDPRHVLLQLPHFERQGGAESSPSIYGGVGLSLNDVRYPEVMAIDIETGQARRVQGQRDGFVDWMVDHTEHVRLGRTVKDASIGYDYRENDDAPWHTVRVPTPASLGVFQPVAFSEREPDILYVRSDHEGGSEGLYAFSLKQARFVKTVAYRAGHDVRVRVKGHRLIGYGFDGGPETFLDADWAHDQKVLDQAMPDTANRLIDRSTDGQRVLFFASHGNAPGSYWLLDRSSGKTEARELIALYADLPDASIASTRHVHYKARDGLDIPALLTLPVGASASSGLPFVVLPHGGPAAHDAAGFDPWVQLLVSRGYGVLQPQFRGSTGYGRELQVAGHQQWGLSMQDDVTDGTRWLVQQKWADPKRICIVGASYGGYAALEGVEKEPDLYKCAVAFAPVTDLVDLSSESFDFAFGEFDRDQIGRDLNQLAKTSPTRHVDAIRVPVLLMHGRQDFVVPVSHSEKFAAAMNKAGKKVETLYLDHADHYLSRQADRTDVFSAMTRFLAAQLDPPAAQSSAP